MAPSNETSKAQKDLQSLRGTIESTLGLLQQFQTSLSLTSSSASNGDTNSGGSPTNAASNDLPDPLAVLHTAATLLRAHTTKLGLLMINKPFTPSAIMTVLREVQTSCLPAIMGAVEICCTPVPSSSSSSASDGQSSSTAKYTYSQTLQTEVRSRVRRVFAELPHLLHEILRIGRLDDSSSSTSTVPPSSTVRQTGVISNSKDSRDSLASTGVVWDACDALIDLRDKGLAGIVVKKAQGYRDMLNDAISELREWSEDVESDDDDDDDDANTADDTKSGAGTDDEEDEDEDEFDDLFGASKKLPKNDTQLRAQLDTALKKLKLISTLYQALIKRRLQTVPTVATSGNGSGSGGDRGDKKEREAAEKVNTTIDTLITTLKQIPDETDELANAFYELDATDAAAELDKCVQLAKSSIDLVRKNWAGQEDEYTVWAGRWVDAVEKMA